MNRIFSFSTIFCVCWWLLAGSFMTYGQEKEDTSKVSIRNSRLAKEIMSSITTTPKSDTVFNLKSEDAFIPYEGKIIHKIIIQHIGFERSFYNGNKKVWKKVVDVGNALHSTTREKTIRENLFIRENKPLNAYKVADNERYLRDLEFILDARIEVLPLGVDSVDLVVYTRDVFSLGGDVSPRSATKYRFGIYDANLAGWGQRIQFNGLIDQARDPVFGEEILYKKASLGRSLINLSAGYTRLNGGSSYGEEDESAYYLKLSRPLVSPYTRMAGGAEWSKNWSKNYYRKADSLFLDYKYNIYDFWIGYNIGVNNMAVNRSRHLVAMRWFHQNFTERPLQPWRDTNALYNDNSYVLGEVTFFNQNFYKTRFIYGFGRTEDVPYGYSASVAAGWANQLHLKRLYVSAGINKKVVDRNGDFFEGDIRTATYWHNNGAEDATVLISLSWFSRLMLESSLKIRQYIRASYAAQINRTLNQPLNIGNDFGVRGFRTDSLRGERRLGFTTETVFFTRWKLLGFHFAPLTFADVAFLPPAGKHVFYDKPFAGLGAGMRSRNENLIFGTIELRFTWYPRIVEDITRFKVSISSNLRVKYSSSFVQAPGFLKFN